MNDAVAASFVPVLTVMVDYGNAPFLWLVDSPDAGGIGPNLCDGTYWDESFPISEGLWRKFAGPRESKRPGIYRLTRELLEAVDAALHPV